MKHIVCVCACLLAVFVLRAQPRKTENLIIVTLDGMRWQEVFRGVDKTIMNKKRYTRNRKALKETFWDENVEVRRKKLMPFLWTTMYEKGRLLGNRDYGNYVDVTNKYRLSYPGYNELFTGYPDVEVKSNDKVYNKNTNVLEFINRQRGFEGKVAVFSTWDVFPYILNQPRSNLYVNADKDSLPFSDSRLQLVDKMQALTTRPLGVRPDVFTYFAAREYLRSFKPRVLYIAFDETDEAGHNGSYDQYVDAAHAADAMIRDLWEYIQMMPEYADKTTLIVTCDHGRGYKTIRRWREHGRKIKEASEIWIAAIGPDTRPGGEARSRGRIYQRQIATTLAALLGFDFKSEHPVLPPLISSRGRLRSCTALSPTA